APLGWLQGEALANGREASSRLREMPWEYLHRSLSYRTADACAAMNPRCASALRPLVSTLTTTDIPGRSSRCVVTSAGTSIRTGRRCTILVKLPVALSGGSSENTAPEAGDRLATVPGIVCPGRASTLIETVWPGCSRASCVSLKFAST